MGLTPQQTLLYLEKYIYYEVYFNGKRYGFCSEYDKKEFEENGIQIIYRTDIAPFDDFDTKYALSKTDSHPNENAWEYIVPKLVEKLGINDN